MKTLTWVFSLTDSSHLIAHNPTAFKYRSYIDRSGQICGYNLIVLCMGHDLVGHNLIVLTYGRCIDTP